MRRRNVPEPAFYISPLYSSRHVACGIRKTIKPSGKLETYSPNSQHHVLRGLEVLCMFYIANINLHIYMHFYLQTFSKNVAMFNIHIARRVTSLYILLILGKLLTKYKRYSFIIFGKRHLKIILSFLKTTCNVSQPYNGMSNKPLHSLIIRQIINIYTLFFRIFGTRYFKLIWSFVVRTDKNLKNRTDTKLEQT